MLAGGGEFVPGRQGRRPCPRRPPSDPNGASCGPHDWSLPHPSLPPVCTDIAQTPGHLPSLFCPGVVVLVVTGGEVCPPGSQGLAFSEAGVGFPASEAFPGLVYWLGASTFCLHWPGGPGDRSGWPPRLDETLSSCRLIVD